MAGGKTNAMRILDGMGVHYDSLSYEAGDGKIDGVSVAGKIGKPLEQVFKTLVCAGHSGEYYVMAIPVAEELDLKAAAQAVKEKSLELIPVKDIMKVTGYIRGGCSPIGMKKQYPVVVDETCQLFDEVIVSAGKIGLQVCLAPMDLLKSAHAQMAAITRDKG